MTKKLCAYPGCTTRQATYFMGWKDSEGNKQWGYVCATHDKFHGRKNLMGAGMTLEEAIAFEREKEVEFEKEKEE